MKTDTPTRTPGGRISFVDETTLVYVPLRDTTGDAAQALRDIYRSGIMRPVRTRPEGRERVYPVEFCPTDDPHVYGAWFRTEDGELVTCTLHVAHARIRTTPGPWEPWEPAAYTDPFTVESLPKTPPTEPLP